MVGKKQSKWTDELVDKLKIFYLEKNYSTVEIAKKLGFTKNAIIGKLHRLKISRDLYLPEEEEEEDIIKPLPKKGELRLEDIESDMCVWPYGDDDFTFCGDPIVHGKQYCEEHLSMVYLAIKKIPKRSADEIYTEEDIDIIIEE